MKRNDLTLTDLGDNISKLKLKTSPNFTATDTLATAKQAVKRHYVDENKLKDDNYFLRNSTFNIPARLFSSGHFTTDDSRRFYLKRLVVYGKVESWVMYVSVSTNTYGTQTMKREVSVF
jgi:hypothetical protein